jgi:S-(hydroxymethyl)glutathione dehydrogenase/alcohol dehydrogenase
VYRLTAGRAHPAPGRSVIAAVVDAVGSGFSIEDISIAAPIGREVLVDVKAVGLCHTDHTIATMDMGFAMPSVLGHEVAGVVVSVGPTVTSVAVGDHVVGCLAQSCGGCARCLDGRPVQCHHPEATLRGGDQPPRLSRHGDAVSQIFGLGGFAEQALIHENQLVAIAKDVPFPQAALLGCGVLTGAGAVLNTANVRAGDSVVIIGVGGVGINAVSGAVLAGASTIIAVDLDDIRLATATRFGATHVINSATDDVVAAVAAITTTGADHIFDFVGTTAVATSCVSMLAVGGGLYLVGVADPAASVAVSIVSSVLRQTRVQGVNLGSSNFKRDIPFYADLYLQGRMNLDDLVSLEISLAQIEDGYARMKDPAITRTVITSF